MGARQPGPRWGFLAGRSVRASRSTRYHEPHLSASYTKRKSMASKYLSALRALGSGRLLQLHPSRDCRGTAGPSVLRARPDPETRAPRETLIRAWRCAFKTRSVIPPSWCHIRQSHAFRTPRHRLWFPFSTILGWIRKPPHLTRRPAQPAPVACRPPRTYRRNNAAICAVWRIH